MGTVLLKSPLKSGIQRQGAKSLSRKGRIAFASSRPYVFALKLDPISLPATRAGRAPASGAYAVGVWEREGKYGDSPLKNGIQRRGAKPPSRQGRIAFASSRPCVFALKLDSIRPQ
jgi:hypothetical protein